MFKDGIVIATFPGDMSTDDIVKRAKKIVKIDAYLREDAYKRNQHPKDGIQIPQNNIRIYHKTTE